MTPKEKIVQIIKNNDALKTEQPKVTVVLFPKDIGRIADKIILYISEATGIDISQLKDDEEEIN